MLHKQPISERDMNTLYKSKVFSLETPKTLENKVFFDPMLYLCQRGREKFMQLKKNSFVVHY